MSSKTDGRLPSAEFLKNLPRVLEDFAAAFNDMELYQRSKLQGDEAMLTNLRMCLEKLAEQDEELRLLRVAGGGDVALEDAREAQREAARVRELFTAKIEQTAREQASAEGHFENAREMMEGGYDLLRALVQIALIHEKKVPFLEKTLAEIAAIKARAPAGKSKSRPFGRPCRAALVAYFDEGPLEERLVASQNDIAAAIGFDQGTISKALDDPQGEVLRGLVAHRKKLLIRAGDGRRSTRQLRDDD